MLSPRAQAENTRASFLEVQDHAIAGSMVTGIRRVVTFGGGVDQLQEHTQRLLGCWEGHLEGGYTGAFIL